MAEESMVIRQLSDQAGGIAEPLIAGGGTTGDDSKDAAILKQVNAASERVNQFVFEETIKVLKAGKVPGIIGGEHSVPFGAIRACAEHYGPFGILHIDAHMDLRVAFEGFEWSHASIMHNVLTRIPQVRKIVQVGIRDFGERELEFATAQGERAEVHFDDHWAQQMGDGAKLTELCAAAVRALPIRVYVSFDIDALDPSLCPHTGTPVPWGLGVQSRDRALGRPAPERQTDRWV